MQHFFSFGTDMSENSHANSRFSHVTLFLFGKEIKSETLIQTLASQLSLIFMQLVWPGHESWENSHTNSRFSTLVNSHATLVLVWPGHESWENSHSNSRLSTLMQLLFLVWPAHESWKSSHTNSRLSILINSHVTLVLVWTERNFSISCKLSLVKLSLCNFCSRLIRTLD